MRWLYRWWLSNVAKINIRQHYPPMPTLTRELCRDCGGSGVIAAYDGPSDWVLVHDEPCPCSA